MMIIENFGNGYTVFFEGDEIYFDTEEEAKAFINEMEKMTKEVR